MKSTLKYKFAAILTLLISSSSGYAAAPFFTDGFEANSVGTDGDNLTGEASNNGSSWGAANVGSGDSITVQSSIVHTGNRALRFQCASGGDLDDAWVEQNFTFGSEVEDLYVKFYIYFPDGTEPGENAYVHRDTSSSDNNKFFRVWNNDYNYGKWGATLNRDTDDTSRVTARGNVDAGCGDNDNIPDLLDVYNIGGARLGQWIEFQFRVKSDSGAGDGAWQVWIDGDYVDGDTSITTTGAPCSPRTFMRGYLLGWSNSGFSEATNIYIDDVAFSDAYIGVDVSTYHTYTGDSGVYLLYNAAD